MHSQLSVCCMQLSCNVRGMEHLLCCFCANKIRKMYSRVADRMYDHRCKYEFMLAT